MKKLIILMCLISAFGCKERESIYKSDYESSGFWYGGFRSEPHTADNMLFSVKRSSQELSYYACASLAEAHTKTYPDGGRIYCLYLGKREN